MTDDKQPANGGAAAAKQAQAPRLSIQNQYIKDLSFENPTPLRPAASQNVRPEIGIKVDVRARPLDGDNHEVELELNVNAKSGDDVVFVLELTYGSVFIVANVPPESLQPLLMIECPRLIFPFARRIIADCTRDGGFPPLMVDPIDFAALFRNRLQQAAAAKAEAEAAAKADDAGSEPTLN